MRERPILFSPPMIRAILAGTKTQTRRVVRPQPPKTTEGFAWVARGEHSRWVPQDDTKAIDRWVLCPYGQPGDRLWVRETYAVYGEFKDGTGYCYKADGDKAGVTWKSPLFMPRAASRILLELTSVRVERVQDISHSDAMAEGVGAHTLSGAATPLFAQLAYRDLWDSLNAKRGYGWESNPWVWCIEFRRIAP